MTVAVLAVGLVIGATAMLLVITPFKLDAVLFESISAFATVGMSTDITPDLPATGQVVLIVLMFFGRLGPITLAAARPLHSTSTLRGPSGKAPR